MRNLLQTLGTTSVVLMALVLGTGRAVAVPAATDFHNNSPTRLGLTEEHVQFYSYTPVDGGLKVSLTDEFRAELDKAEGGSFTDVNGITWTTGQPVPNPAPDGMHNGDKVVDFSSLYANLGNIVELDCSLVDTRYATTFSNMFYGNTKLATIKLGNWNTENVTNMEFMFSFSNEITTIEGIEKLNTANVTNMAGLFMGTAFTSVDLSAWNTRKVTDFHLMFSSYTLDTLLLGPDFDMSSCTTESGVNDMFGYYDSEKHMKIRFACDTAPYMWCTDYSSLYKATIYAPVGGTGYKTMQDNLGATTLSYYTSTDSQGWATVWMPEATTLPTGTSAYYCSTVKDNKMLLVPATDALMASQAYIIKGNPGEELLFTVNADATPQDVSAVNLLSISQGSSQTLTAGDNYTLAPIGDNEDGFAPYDGTQLARGQAYLAKSSMPSASRSQQALHLVYSLDEFYAYTPVEGGMKVSLTDEFRAELSKAEGGSLTDVNGITWTTGQPVPNPAPLGLHNGDKVVDYSSLYANLGYITELDASQVDTRYATTFSGMFYGNYSLNKIKLGNWNTENVTNMEFMFGQCRALTRIDGIENFNTSKVDNLHATFLYCFELDSLDLGGWTTDSVTNMEGLFIFCNKLSTVGDISRWNTSRVTNMFQVFGWCEALTSLDLSGWGTSSVTNMHMMFKAANSLKSLTLGSDFAMTASRNATYVFEDASSLQLIRFVGETAPEVSAAWDMRLVTAPAIQAPVGGTGYKALTSTLSGSSLSYYRTTDTLGWTTVWMPENTTVPEGTDTYYCSKVEGDKMTLTRVNESLMGGQAFIVKSEDPGTELLFTVDELYAAPQDVSAVNLLLPSQGSAQTLTAGDNFVLAQLSADEAGFAPHGDTTLARGHAFLPKARIPEASRDYQALHFEYDQGTVGIGDINAENGTARRGVYNMQGQYLGDNAEGLPTGIYIVDGKKTVVK